MKAHYQQNDPKTVHDYMSFLQKNGIISGWIHPASFEISKPKAKNANPFWEMFEAIHQEIIQNGLLNESKIK